MGELLNRSEPRILVHSSIGKFAVTSVQFIDNQQLDVSQLLLQGTQSFLVMRFHQFMVPGLPPL